MSAVKVWFMEASYGQIRIAECGVDRETERMLYVTRERVLFGEHCYVGKRVKRDAVYGSMEALRAAARKAAEMIVAEREEALGRAKAQLAAIEAAL